MDQRRSDKKVYPGFLMCPSGHIKESEKPLEALGREMNEELGLNNIQAKYLFSIRDTDPVSKLRFNHKFYLIQNFAGKIKFTREGEKLKWQSYGLLKKLKLAKVVSTLVQKLHKANLI